MSNLKGLSKTEARKRLNERIKQAGEDPIVFIDRFLYTFNPKVEPYHLPFRLFDFQKDLVKDLCVAIERGDDLFIEKCREMGATYTVLAVFLWYWRYVPGSNFLVGSRKEQYVDSTKGNADDLSNKEESLFGKLEYMISRMPRFLQPKGFDYRRHQTYMSLLNPENGNVIVGESSNPHFSRGGRSKAILLDEFAFWENDKAAWGSTADTTNCRIVLTTPGIRPGKAKRLRYGKDGEKIKIITLPYQLDPRKTKKWLEKERTRRSTEDFAREIMINWEASITGRVYPETKNGKVGEFPYNPVWTLFATWDFGLDGVGIQWWQTNPKTKQMRIIDAYFNKDKPIQFYYPLLGVNQFVDVSGKLIKCANLFTYTDDDLLAHKETSRYKNPQHFGDPDVAKRSLLTGTSTRQALAAVDIYITTNAQSNDFVSRRERTQVMLQRGFEVNENERTDFWMECMTQARYPQREETSQSTTPVNKPIHDWTSHHRTATEYLAVNYDAGWEPDDDDTKDPENTPGTFEYHLKKRKQQRIMLKD